MKKFIKVALLMSILVLSACSTPRQVQNVPIPEKSYRLPACHHEIHRKLLEQQNRLIILSEHGDL